MRLPLSGSIAGRLYGLLALFLVGFAGLVTYQLLDLRSNLDSFKRTELQSVVQAATSIVQNFYDRSQAGEFSEDQAKALALETLRGLRYQGNEYIFVDSFDMINLMHPTKPEKQGSDRSVETDGNGKLYLREMIGNVAANGSAFETYYFKTPEGPFKDKVTYAQGFKPWGWSIASGVLFETVDAAFSQAATMSAIIAIGATLVLMLVGYLIVRSLTRPMKRLNANMVEIAQGHLETEVEGLGRKDEIGAMARAVEVFRENGKKVAEMTEAEAAAIVRNQAERTRMMAQLQNAFGDVVDAAVAGDFTRRVNADFPDAELNALAGSVNNLVETVDAGLNETSTVLSHIAAADLTQRVTGTYRGAFGRLKDDTNAVAERLSDIVSQLQQTSRTLKTATGEILSGANDLSERTTKQAATIEETSATMEQLAGTVTDNARKADAASGQARTVASAAEEGGQVMAEANRAMERITDSSAKISNIIGMIDDIAFQTNLLALNASVEAARAGEAGKGFAVVAVEVRRLAQSAAEASSEVKTLIEQSASEVSGGSRLVADAAAKLVTMMDGIRTNNAALGGIASASREQAASIDEVNTAVRQMDEMTQHNAALVEEMNAAIEQTEAQASELDRIADIFTLSDTPRRAAASAPASRPATAKAATAKAAARTYLSNGNAAIDQDWAEF